MASYSLIDIVTMTTETWRFVNNRTTEGFTINTYEATDPDKKGRTIEFWTSFCENVTYEYRYYNGVLHDEYGPAVVMNELYTTILEKYYLEGVEYSFEEWETRIKCNAGLSETK